ncbi:MAG: hypothetical protein ACREL3_03835 [Gemmatimonadales bacterium]
MRSHPMLGTLLLMGACGGGTYFTTLTASPAASPSDAIACARSKLREVGYQQTSLDETDFRLTARKIDNTVHRAEPQFRRNVNRLEIEAAAGADGKTALTVVGHTFAEYSTQRGPTEVEEKASADVSQAAHAVVQSCGQS